MTDIIIIIIFIIDLISYKADIMSEKFELKWNDFNTNVAKSFATFRNEEEFFDVTLVGDDHKKYSAHRLVLSACSNYFKNMLKDTHGSKILLCLNDVQAEDIDNILNYVYNGQVRLLQEKLNRFLDVAQRFQLEGLIGKNEEHPQGISRAEDDFHVIDLIETPKTEEDNLVKNHNPATRQKLQIQTGKFSSLQDLDLKIKEMMTVDQSGKNSCSVCGYSSNKSFNVKEHIETHIDGLTFSCDLCNTQLRSRTTLRNHRNYKCKMINRN